MKVTTEKKDNATVLIVEGDVDTLTAPELDNAVAAAAQDCEKLILDLGGVDYISSAGIRVIVKARQQVGGDKFALRNITPNVTDVLKMTGFLRVITIE